MNNSARSNRTNSHKQFSPLTPKLAWQLAAPHTWTAAFVGVMFSCVYASTQTKVLDLSFTIILLVICVLMQSAVNVFNDYYDYIKGTDSLDNSSLDSFDAVLVYNNLNPRSVLILGCSYLGVAGLLGIYLVMCRGWIPLVIGVIGAIIVVLYSAGKTPISYLPIGEAVSGIVMGILIPLACVYVLTGDLDWAVVLFSLPLALGIAMILATNNTSDIEKDIPAQRKTLAVVLGRDRAVSAYRASYSIWIALTLVLIALFYTGGLMAMAFMLIGIFPVARAVFRNPLTQETRDASMSQIIMSNVIISAFYCLAILMDSSIVWLC